MADKSCMVARIPNEQTFVYSITPNAGGLFNAEALGKQIEAISRLLRLASREDGVRVAVAVTRISLEADGVFNMALAILPWKDQSLSKNRSTQQAGK